MLSRWENVLFGFLPYKGTYLIKGWDDISIILDEDIVST